MGRDLDCPRCGEPINLDLLRCGACGHDMLPQDITQRPGANDSRPARTEGQFAEALLAVTHVAEVHAGDEGSRARIRVTWQLIVAVLGVMIGIELVLSIL